MVTVAVGVGAYNAQDVFIPDGPSEQPWGYGYDTIVISSQNLIDLLSEDGAGECQGKPQGTFRVEDLWPFIDRVRNEREGRDGK